MGLLSGIVKLGKYAYRAIKYGKQVGKTAKNGNKVYKRGSVMTGVSKDGKVLGQVKTTQTAANTTETVAKHPIPFSDRYKYSRRITQESRVAESTDIFRCERDAAGRQYDIYDTPWHIEYYKNRKTGVIEGIQDTYKKHNLRTFNEREAFTNYKPIK